MVYSQLLSVVYKRLAKSWGVAVTHEEANTFGASVPDWPDFSDSVAALLYLKKHYKLVILSNVDRVSGLDRNGGAHDGSSQSPRCAARSRSVALHNSK